MKYKGITYDIGTEYSPNILSRDNLTQNIITSDIEVIKNNLNCNSIRIYGKDSTILLLTAEIALQKGLNVWLSPRLINESSENTIIYLKNLAREFELLRLKYPDQELIFIIGAEITIDMKGFVKGNTIQERILTLLKPLFFIKNALGINPEYQISFDKFLINTVSLVRKEFSGKITYSSAMWEKVDWLIFDIVSINLYKASFNKSHFVKTLKKMISKGKPVVITEFGCCSYNGAENKGPAGHTVLDSSKNPPSYKETCIRNEKVQSDYLIDLLQTYEKEKAAGTFVFDFYSQKLTYSSNPDYDYDMASYGITKSLGNNIWEPKESFFKIADYYKFTNR